jgi:hypothetical protein
MDGITCRVALHLWVSGAFKLFFKLDLITFIANWLRIGSELRPLLAWPLLKLSRCSWAFAKATSETLAGEGTNGERKQDRIRFKIMTNKLTRLLAVAALMGLPAFCQAHSLKVTDLNSGVTVNPHAGGAALTWEVDGVQHLVNQSFWYRVGRTGGERPVTALRLVRHGTADTDGDGAADTAYLKYLSDLFSMDIRYSLAGQTAGSFNSDLGTTVTIRNNRDRALDFHLFQYSDFNLNGTAGDDSALMTGVGTVKQTDPRALVSETQVSPAASHWEIALAGVTLSSLSDASPTTLSDTGGLVGPADVAWALQWDVRVPRRGTLVIHNGKHLARVPDAGSTVILLGLAMTGLGLAIRGRHRK